MPFKLRNKNAAFFDRQNLSMKEYVSLKKTEDFGRAYRQGKSYGNKLLVIYYFERGQNPEVRVGISVSKKVGNSVERHKIKRQLKECFRTRLDWWKDGIDVVVVARREIKDKDYNKILEALVSAGIHLGICDPR